MPQDPPLTPEKVEVQPIWAAKVYTQSGTDPSDIGAAFAAAFGRIHEFLESSGVQVGGPPRAIYTSFEPGEAEFTVAMPVVSGAEGGDPSGDVVVDELPGGSALRFTHRGPYSRLSETYDRITEWMKGEGMLQTEAEWEAHGPVWEEYVTDPETTPEGELVTFIYVPMP